MLRPLLTATIIAWAIIELRQGLNRRGDAQTVDKGSRVIVQLGVVVGLAVGIAVTRSMAQAPIGRIGATGWFALGVLWCGVALRAWCFHTLGRYFTFSVATSSDQEVIAAGPYRVLRHPSYAAILLIVIGLAMFDVDWAGLVIVVAVTLAGLVYRIHVEERALLSAVGSRYAEYMAGRKRLIPFVW